LDIIFENHEFLALNKPGCLPVHPGTGHQDSLAGRVSSIYQEAAFKPTPVHRLDKDTSGLILFAKSYSWLREIQEMWKSGQVEKVYQVWVNGKWEHGTGPIVDNLYRFSDKVRVSENGKPALSWVTRVLQKKQVSLLQISLKTGRTHQIRVQLAERGFPIIGDKKYGGEKQGFNKMLLHCFKIAWPGHDLRVAPDWPADLKPPEKLV
jgi:23S rRNA pseudouridine955/2504/2580 synthase